MTRKRCSNPSEAGSSCWSKLVRASMRSRFINIKRRPGRLRRCRSQCQGVIWSFSLCRQMPMNFLRGCRKRWEEWMGNRRVGSIFRQHRNLLERDLMGRRIFWTVALSFTSFPSMERCSIHSLTRPMTWTLRRSKSSSVNQRDLCFYVALGNHPFQR